MEVTDLTTDKMIHNDEFVSNNGYYAFTDVETTGFAKLRNGVITLATYVTDKDHNLIDEFYMEVRPDGAKHVVWSIDAEKVHKIPWERAIKFPPMEESVPRFKEFLDKFGPLTFIAHNMPFDRRMVKELFDKTGHLSVEFSKRFPEQWCTLQLLRKSGLIQSGTKSLGEVCKQLGIEHDHHDARSDAKVLIEIHKRITQSNQGNDALFTSEETNE